MKKRNPITHNGRTDYKNRSIKTQEHILEPNEYDRMIKEFLLSNPIKVIITSDKIEEKWVDIE